MTDRSSVQSMKDQADPLELLSMVVEAFAEPAAVIDSEFRIVVANAAARSLVPALIADETGALCCRLIHGRPDPCPEPETTCALRDAARGVSATVRHEYVEPNGARRIVAVTATPLRDRGGGVAGIFQTVRDMTETVRTEEVLSRARNEWLTTADSVPDLILLTDLDRRIVRCNRAARDFFGMEYRDLVGRELGSAITLAQGDTSVLDTGRGEMRCERPRAVLEVASYAAHVQDRRYGTVWVMRDVTTVRRLESVAASVDMINNLGHVLATVRHEIGNPINAIKTALSVLRERFDAFPVGKKLAYIDRCLDDVGRVQGLLENLRTFNMFDAVRCEQMHLGEFLHSIGALVEEQLRQQGIAFDLRVPGGGCGEVLADRRALHQVLLGLISNAADAVAGRKRPRIRLEAERDGDAVRIGVVDNGAGIASTDISMVFLPLYTTKPNGTGLGLAIARNLVTRMNGTIEISSRFGRGTRVEVVLECLEHDATSETNPVAAS